MLTYPSYLICQFGITDSSIEIYQLLLSASYCTIPVYTFSIYIQSRIPESFGSHLPRSGGYVIRRC